VAVARTVLTIGVDVGGTSVRAGVVDADGAVLDTARAATPGQDAALESAIVGVIDELRERHSVRAVGLALAGFITPDRRIVRFAPHLPWRGVPVADRLSARCALPVVIEHDANAAALAERRFGAGAGSGGAQARSSVFVALGTGIGAALLIDGKLYRGAHGVAPELGHLRVVPDGRACPCGKRGCWERYCSGTALVTTLVELLAADPSASPTLARLAAVEARGITGRHVATAARDGDPLGRRAMAELARWLGEGLALIADVYDPEMVIIGGGVSGSAPLFLDDAREHYARVLTGGHHRPLARIRTAQLGDEGGVIGAAQLARERCR
jgi:glucokinase